MSYDWYDEMERAEQEYDAKENEIAQEYKRGYEQGRADYEAECQKIFEDNPPMHFNHEQIMWLKEFVKIRCNQARADQKEEDNSFFNFEGAWELEKKKVRADAIDELRTELIDMIRGDDGFTDWQIEEMILCIKYAIGNFKEKNK